MKNRAISIGIALVLLLALLAWPFTARAASLSRIIVGGNFTLEDGEVLDEGLTILGGNVTLGEGSEVKGSVQLFGGRLEVNGAVEGDILAAGGFLSLGETARVEGDVTVAGAVLDRHRDAVIEGKLVTENEIPFTITRFDGLWAPFQWWMNSVWNVAWFLGLAFALAALAVLVMMFFEKQTQNVARSLVAQPTISAGMGCLTAVVLPLALIILILSICLSPVAFVLALLTGVAITFGWIALGYEVGRRLADQLHQEWAPPFATGIGTFFLVLVGGMLNMIPCIGWVFTAAVSAAGIGAVLLTRFGLQDYAALVSAGITPAAASLPTDLEK